MTSMRLLKKDLRQRARTTLAELSSESIATQTSRATNTLVTLEQYKAARRISVFLSMPSGELSTTNIVLDALGSGKRVFVPYTYTVPSSTPGKKSQSAMDMVEMLSKQDFEAMVPDKWGIPTPSAESVSGRLNCFGGRGKSIGEDRSVQENEDPSGLDLVVMPGMSFDRTMGRLGHGKGFYDSFLDRYQQHIQNRSQEQIQMPLLVGLALDEQMLPDGSVPMDATDWRLDAIITGSGAIIRR